MVIFVEDAVTRANNFFNPPVIVDCPVSVVSGFWHLFFFCISGSSTNIQIMLSIASQLGLISLGVVNMAGHK